MSRARKIFAILLLLAGFGAQAETWTYEDVGRVVALSDVHGAHDTLLETLRAADVIDDNGAWVGGDTHLVVLGDLLDRGADSRASMDFLMRLEAEAIAAGGRVHVLVGNHEVMNLVGDLRYVNAGEYAAFAGEETAAMRDAAFDALVARDADAAPTRADFDSRFPAGFFAHREAFLADGRYGAWLLERPVMVVVNRTAFVHGGVSPVVAELGLDGLNNGMMQDVRDYVRMLPSMYEAGLLHPTDEFFDHVSIVNAASAARDDANAELVAEFVRLNASPIHDLDGPLWYRGNIACGALIENERLDASLAAVGADRVAIGHTPTPTREILSRLDGRVIEVDTGMNAEAYRGVGSVLILENGEPLSRSGPDYEKQAIALHPRQVGSRPGGFLPLEETLAILQDGEIVSRRKDDTLLVTLEMGGRTLEARFDKRGGKNFYPELAAFRLDRLLGLDMIPPTVRRTVDGKDGTLQLHVSHAVTEAQRAESGQGGGAHCPLGDQWAAMYLFDAVIHNLGRAKDTMVYDQKSGWQLLSIGHGNGFHPKAGVPPWLSAIELTPNAEWRRQLAALSDTVIEEQFADVLDKRRIRALQKRRDLLLGD